MNMLFIYTVHISQSAFIEQFQKNGGMGYNSPLLQFPTVKVYKTQSLFLYYYLLIIASFSIKPTINLALAHLYAEQGKMILLVVEVL